MKTRTAIFASGNGSTAEAFIRAEAANDGLAETVLVITNNPDAGILQRVANLNTELGLDIQMRVINSKTNPDSESTAIISALTEAQVELVLLLGYMKLIAPEIIAAFPNLLNTHPGLLPTTAGTYGVHASELVLDQHLHEAGQVLHVVSETYDEGVVIAENKVPVEVDDTAESLFARIQLAEKAHLASDVDAFIKTL